MQFSLTKNTGKPHTLSYKRDDGSVTWMPADDFFVRHDLSHFAIEKTLGYRTAFLGMLNNGMDIRAFEDRAQRRQVAITAEAAYAENMANFFLIEISQGEWEDFNAVVAESFVPMGTSFPAVRLAPEELAAIRGCLRELLQQWNELPAGQTMTLYVDL